MGDRVPVNGAGDHAIRRILWPSAAGIRVPDQRGGAGRARGPAPGAPPCTCLVGTLTAITGDLGAYLLARALGKTALRVVGVKRLAPAEQVLRRRGAAGIFLSRWLLTPVGPALNLVCGLTRYPVRRFATLIVLGQLIWVISYVLLGRIFSSQVQRLTALMSDLSWLVLVIVLAGVGLGMLGRAARAMQLRQRVISVDE
jgi:membrane protein DedA with SNARE-associated domain